MFTEWKDILDFVEFMKTQVSKDFELVELKNMFNGWENNTSK